MTDRKTSATGWSPTILYLVLYLGAALPLLLFGIGTVLWLSDSWQGLPPPRLYPMAAAIILCIAGPVVGLLVCLRRRWGRGWLILATTWLLVFALVMRHAAIHGA